MLRTIILSFQKIIDLQINCTNLKHIFFYQIGIPGNHYTFLTSLRSLRSLLTLRTLLRTRLFKIFSTSNIFDIFIAKRIEKKTQKILFRSNLSKMVTKNYWNYNVHMKCKFTVVKRWKFLRVTLQCIRQSKNQRYEIICVRWEVLMPKLSNAPNVKLWKPCTQR